MVGCNIEVGDTTVTTPTQALIRKKKSCRGTLILKTMQQQQQQQQQQVQQIHTIALQAVPAVVQVTPATTGVVVVLKILHTAITRNRATAAPTIRGQVAI